MSQVVYLSMGGNFEASPALMHEAVALLLPVVEGNELEVSSLYETSPFEVSSPCSFFNIVCSFRTKLPPRKLFEKIESIESGLGKVPKAKSASRLIDIDILFYGGDPYEDDYLAIPHPRWKERLFVLVPLLELTPTILIRQKEATVVYDIKEMIDQLSKQTDDWVKKFNKFGEI